LKEPNLETSLIKTYLEHCDVSPIKLKSDIEQVANSLQNAYPLHIIKYFLLNSIKRVDWKWLQNERNKSSGTQKTP